jgi:hypothetical protein
MGHSAQHRLVRIIRRLTIRYERRLDIPNAVTSLACTVICMGALLHGFEGVLHRPA